MYNIIKCMHFMSFLFSDSIALAVGDTSLNKLLASVVTLQALTGMVMEEMRGGVHPER